MVRFSEIHSLLICFFISMLLVIITIAIWIILDERKKVKQMPRRPMLLCDAHGAYPASDSIHIEVPGEEGRASLKQEICPQCYYDRLKKVKGMLK